VCDNGDGLRWPTAPGKCATVRMATEGGAGYYSLERCTSPTCDPESCTTLTTWAPAQTSDSLPKFDCRQLGSDAATIVDECATVVGNIPDSAFCGHPGLINGALESVQQYIVKCEIAPRCPENVLPDTLEQTCCLGTDKSFATDGGGSNQAKGFCALGTTVDSLVGKPVNVEILSATGLRDADETLQGNSDPYCTGAIVGRPTTLFQTKIVDDTQDPTFNSEKVMPVVQDGDAFEFVCWDRDFGDPDDLLGQAVLPTESWEAAPGFDGEIKLTETGGAQAYIRVRITAATASPGNDCSVRTFANGWRGCACLGLDSMPLEDRVCTVDCTLQGCGDDGSGIPPTPERWRTSAVPGSLVTNDRSARVASSASQLALASRIVAGACALVAAMTCA